MTFDEQFYKLLADVVKNEGYEEVVRIRSYSGRGMMGRKCLSIQGDENVLDNVFRDSIMKAGDDMFGEALEGDEIKAEELRDFFHRVCDTITDNQFDRMGYDSVVYWKNVQYCPPQEAEDGPV